ncbi:MAG: HDOD domain-containing protein [Treponema sp.]|jgi:putative nucleotidyltransferase with HDIG domain|nr:HDOD domain-containing protein [Treponema sp.]
MDDLLENIQRYIKSMPSLPTTVAKVLEVCNNPKTSPADLNQVISLDPVLVGRVLKLINSAYYSPSRQVTSLVRAIIMLGINTVKNLALSLAVMESLHPKRNAPGLNMDGFWRHSLCVGVAAKTIAKKRGVDIKLREEYFTAGLLHDIGKIPLNAVLTTKYMLTVSSADRERNSLFLMEDRTLGINHCASGAMIVHAWRLTGAVAEVIEHHHTYLTYQGSFRDILFTVAAANQFAASMEIGFSGDRYPAKIDPSVWEYLGFNRDVFEELEPLVMQAIEKAQIFLKL